MSALRTLGPALALLALAACGGGDGEAPEAKRRAAEPPRGASSGSASDVPEGALPELVASLRADRDAERHPSDGGGRAWIEEGPERVAVGTRAAWTFVYEAGPEGIAEGGVLFLMTSPFWGWSPPQPYREDAPGYTEVETEAEGVSLEPALADAQLLAVAVRGRALRPGERVRIRYGAGPSGAAVDRHAERGERFRFAVDGDGDGVRAFVEDPPAVDVLPGAPARLALHLPSRAAPGEAVELRLAVLDEAGNAGVPFEGRLELELPAGLAGPESVALAAEDAGRTPLRLEAREAGTYRVAARGPEGLSGESNPLVVEGGAEPLLWADLHGHSRLSDGTATPEGYYRYARDVAGLDVAALTDHDHWGLPFLDETPASWDAIRAAVRRFHAPGRFVALLGYEWTSWIHGHRHVLYFGEGEEGRVWSSLDEATDEPRELWSRLRGCPALTVPHHPAGGPIPIDWSVPPDPELEPVVEVASVHGQSEAPDAPRPIYDAREGHFARDALDRGYRLGFVGSGDGHDGHPGLAHVASGTGGLAALVGAERTRASVLETLRARRVYATNGPRIVVDARLDGEPVGAALPAGPAERTLRARVVAPAPLSRIDLVRSGEVVAEIDAGGERSAELERPVRGLAAGEYLYLRALQEDGGAAWTSPWFGGEEPR